MGDDSWSSMGLNSDFGSPSRAEGVVDPMWFQTGLWTTAVSLKASGVWPMVSLNTLGFAISSHSW